MSEEILPCPFCVHATLESGIRCRDNGFDYWIECDECGYRSGYSGTGSGAIAAHNAVSAAVSGYPAARAALAKGRGEAAP